MKKQLLALSALSILGTLMAPPKRVPQSSSSSSSSSSFSSSSSSSGSSSGSDLPFLSDIPCEVIGGVVCPYLDACGNAALGATCWQFRDVYSCLVTDWRGNRAQTVNFSQICPDNTQFVISPNGMAVMAIMPRREDGRPSAIGIYLLADGSFRESDCDLGDFYATTAISMDKRKFYSIRSCPTTSHHTPSLFSRFFSRESSSSSSSSSSLPNVSALFCCDLRNREMTRLFEFSQDPDPRSGIPGIMCCSLHSINISPDGKRALICINGTRPKIFDLRTERFSDFLSAESPSYDCAFFSPDGKFAALSLSRERQQHVDIVNIESGASVLRLRGHIPTAISSPFSSDGRQIVTVRGLSNTVTIWDAATGEEVASYQCQFQSPTESIQFSFDGSQILIVHRSREIEIWQAGSVYRSELLKEPEAPSRRCIVM